MVPPYSGALIISPVVGSSTISFSIAAAGSSSAAAAQRPVAARTNPTSAAVNILQFRIMRFPPKPCFFESARIQYRPAPTLTVRLRSQGTR